MTDKKEAAPEEPKQASKSKRTKTQEPMTATQRGILTVVLVPVFMSLLAISSINVVLQSIGDTIDISTAQLQWVLSGYTLAFGVLLVAGGRAGDVYGRGKLFVTGLALFGLGSLISGLAPNGITLDIARVIMGFGSGLFNPQTVGFIQQYFDGQRRARAFASFGSVVGVSVAIGPVLGGLLIHLAGPEWGWRWTFLLNVPIAILAIIFAFRSFPESAWKRPPAETSTSTAQIDMTQDPDKASKRPDLDPVGMIMLAAAILMIMWAFMSMADNPWLLFLALGGVVLIALWVWWENFYVSRGREPMINMDIFRTRSFANGSLLIGIYFTGSTSVWITIALYLQSGQGFSALQAATIGLPGAALTAITAQIAGRYVLKMGRAMVAWGMTLALTSILGGIAVVMLVAAYDISPWWLMLPMTFVGGAQGMITSPNQTLSMLNVPPRYSGAAGGVMQTGQRVGTALGLTLITTVAFTVEAMYDWNAAFIVSFAIIALLMLTALIVALVDIQVSKKENRPFAE